MFGIGPICKTLVSDLTLRGSPPTMLAKFVVLAVLVWSLFVGVAAGQGHARYAHPIPAPSAGEPRGQHTEALTEISWWEQRLTESLFSDRRAVPLTLNDALAQALQTAPELQELSVASVLRHDDVREQQAAFDWTPFVDAVWNRDSAPVGSRLDGATERLRSRTSTAAVGLSRLNRSGGTLELSQDFGFRSGNSANLLPNHQGNSRFRLDYRRPLLRGAGEEYNTAAIRLASEQRDLAFDELQIGIEDYLLTVADAYWSVYRQRGRFLLLAKSWQQASRMVEEMERRSGLDVLPSTLQRARLEASERLARAVDAEHVALQAQQLLARLIDSSSPEQWTVSEYLPVSRGGVSVCQVCLPSDPAVAVQNRSEIHRSIRLIRQASIEARLAENEVLPMLNLVLTGYTAGLRPDNDVGQAFLDQIQQGEPGVGVGLRFEIPYRNRAALARASRQQLQVQRFRHQFETAVADVRLDVETRQLEYLRQSHVLAQQETSEQHAGILVHQLETRRELLIDGTEVGRLYLEELLRAQWRETQASLLCLDARTDLRRAEAACLRAFAMLHTLAGPYSAQ